MTQSAQYLAHDEIRHLLDRESPSDTPIEVFGVLRGIVQSLREAHASGGVDAVKQAWCALCKDNPNLIDLIAREPSQVSPFTQYAQTETRYWIDAPPNGDLDLVPTRDLLKMDITEPTWAVDDMIKLDKLTFIVSDGGIGKSWLLLWLSETLGNGG